MTNDSKTINISTRWYDGEAVLRGDYYASNHQKALELFSPVEGPLATATVNLEDYGIRPSAPDNIIVKDYGENEGMVKLLQDAGVIGDEVRRFSFGYVKNGAAEVRVNDEWLSLWDENEVNASTEEDDEFTSFEF